MIFGPALEAPTVVAGLDDVAVVGQAIKQRSGHLGVASMLRTSHCLGLGFASAPQDKRSGAQFAHSAHVRSAPLKRRVVAEMSPNKGESALMCAPVQRIRSDSALGFWSMKLEFLKFEISPQIYRLAAAASVALLLVAALHFSRG